MKNPALVVLIVFLQFTLLSGMAVAEATPEPDCLNKSVVVLKEMPVVAYSAKLSGLNVESLESENYPRLVQEEQAVVTVALTVRGNWTWLQQPEAPGIFLWSTLRCARESGGERIIKSWDKGTPLRMAYDEKNNITEISDEIPNTGETRGFRVEQYDRDCRFEGRFYANQNETLCGRINQEIPVSERQYVITKSEYLQRLSLKKSEYQQKLSLEMSQKALDDQNYWFLIALQANLVVALAGLIVSVYTTLSSHKYMRAAKEYQKKEYELNKQNQEFDHQRYEEEKRKERAKVKDTENEKTH